jgi:hypothetical protein
MAKAKKIKKEELEIIVKTNTELQQVLIQILKLKSILCFIGLQI